MKRITFIILLATTGITVGEILGVGYGVVAEIILYAFFENKLN